MKTTLGVDALQESAPVGPSVVSVGVFDGVHLGHRAILEANCRRAGELSAVPTVVTFRDHPKTLLLGRAPKTLTSLEHRLELFGRAGIEHAVVLDFDDELRAMDADTFTEELLLGALDARAFVLGFDSKFGRDRKGTPEALAERGLSVEVVPAVRLGGRAVSSTAIREAVALGDLAGAAHMLGRPVTLQGTVVHGDGRGKGLGFPTANLDLDHELSPPNGVWAARVRLLDRPASEPLLAVTNIGHRPTLHGQRADLGPPVVEVHILDFEEDLYGQRAAVEFVAFLRAEERFASVDLLVAAIKADISTARRLRNSI